MKCNGIFSVTDICVIQVFIYFIIWRSWGESGFLFETRNATFVFEGCSIEEPDLISAEIFIAAEQKIIMKLPTGCMIEAIKCLLFTYYICNLQYPAECANVYIFMQRRFLKVFDQQKVPTRVMMRMSELLKLQ